MECDPGSTLWRGHDAGEASVVRDSKLVGGCRYMGLVPLLVPISPGWTAVAER